MKRIVRLTERDLSRIVKRVLNEQENQTIQIGTATIQNPKLEAHGAEDYGVPASVEFNVTDMDKETFDFFEPSLYLLEYNNHLRRPNNLTIRVHNLIEESDNKYRINDAEDIEFPNWSEETQYESYERDRMFNHMINLKNSLFYSFE